jgi:hydrogenase 3 maturation protease
MDNILIGIGNQIRKDDRIGCYVAEEFEKAQKEMMFEEWKIIHAETVPENYTSVMRKLNPELIVMVDSAEMNLKPGEFRIINKQMMEKLHLTTHAMPLSFLMTYLGDFCEKVLLIGIQPKELGDGEEMTEEVIQNVPEIIKLIKEKSFNKIKVL